LLWLRFCIPEENLDMKKFSLKLVWQALKDAMKGFSENKVPKLSASLAYYTIFSLGPMLICIIFLSSLFLGQQAVEGEIYGQIRGFIGHDAAMQVQDMIKNASLADSGTFSAIIGIIALLVGATTMFAELQDSVNMIWGLKPKPNVGIMRTIKNRLLSFGLIGSLVFLLLVSLSVTAVISGIGDRLKVYFPDITVVVFTVINWILSLSITTVLFAVVFRVLPDAHIRWRDIFPGALATSILFLLGKFLISFYISTSDIGSTYGAAGSFVVLLVWIYYSSIILYFGAEFTKTYALDKGVNITPNHYAHWDHDSMAYKKRKEKANDGVIADPDRKPRNIKPVPPQQSRREAILHSAASAPRPKSRKEKQSGPGIGTVLLGLAIYFFKNETKRTGHW
jgi:membrane protein